MPFSKEPPAAESHASSRQNKPRGRRRFKWSRRLAYFCGWLVLMVLCLAALLASLAWLGYKNAAPIANIARTKLAADYPIEFGSITFPEKGLIELRDLTLDLPEDGGRAGKIDRIQLRYNPINVLTNPRAKSVLIENPNFTLDDKLLAMFSPKEDDEYKPDSGPMDLGWAKIDKLKIANGTINLDLNGIPKGTWHVDLEAEDIDLSSEGNLLSTKPQRVVLRDIKVDDPNGDQLPALLEVAEITADLSLHKDFTSGALAQLHLKNPVVRFTPALIAALQPEPSIANPTKIKPKEKQESAPMRWTISQVTSENGFFAMTGFYDSPDVSFRHSGVFTDLSWSSDKGLAWPTRQETAITDVRFDARALPSDEFTNPDAQILASANRIEIAGKPDEFFEHGWIEKVTTRRANIHLSEENIRRFLTEAPSDPSLLLMAADEDEEDPNTTASTNKPKPYIIRVSDLEFADAAVTIEADGFMSGLPETTFNLNIRSAENQPDPTHDVNYVLSASELHVHERGSTTAIISGKEILSEFSANGIQRDQRIESVKLSGIQVRVGKEVEDIIAELSSNSSGSQPAPPMAPTTSFEPGLDLDPDPLALSENLTQLDPEWKIGTLDLEETRFALENFIPGLPYVPLVLETTLEEVPLSGRSRGEERLQRIELRNLEIASTSNSLIPVAKLNSIWVHFTVPGLIRSELEKIEIVNPEIYLGEHLFWYVDYYRKLAEGDGGEAEEKKEEVVAAAKDAEPAADPGAGKISLVEDALKNTEVSGWQIKAVEANTGKLIIAPKGYPIGILPFPFTAKTNLAEGKIELDLKVPPGDYVFEQLELELLGLNGQAFFNYPIRAENNNFVQTFRVPQFRFQKYKAADVYLSVTYDENGIYGKLGGEAYGGYAEGEFNIYIGETYKWDAWVAGTNLDIKPITEVLSPENVIFTGTLNAKIIANGEEFVPEKVTGDMHTSGKCHMHVTKLDEVLESLPEPQFSKPKGRIDIIEALIDPITIGLQNAVSKAGIEAFRHYDFTSGDAQLEFDGRNGSASMLLDGPDGKRNFKFQFFDKRELADTVKPGQ